MSERADEQLRTRLTAHLDRVTSLPPSAGFEARLLAVAEGRARRGVGARLRRLAGAAATVAVAGAVAGVTLWAHDQGRPGTSGAVHPGPLATFTQLGPELRFSYPGAWKVVLPPPLLPVPTGDGGFEWSGQSGPSALVALGSQQIKPTCVSGATPCVATPQGGRLDPDGIVVTWTRLDPFSGFNGLSSVAGQAVTIGGRPAKLADGLLADCRAIGGDGALSAIIDQGSDRGQLRGLAMSACWRGPGAAVLEAEARALLASATILTPIDLGGAGYIVPDNPPITDPTSYAYWNVAALAQSVCPGDVWPGSSPTATSTGFPGAMVVLQTPGPCLPPPPGSPADQQRPYDRTLVGTFVVHVDSCHDARAYDVTIVADTQDVLHLARVQPAPRSTHPACP